MKILLLRQDRLGDLLISTGIIRNLRKLLPNSEIHILLGNKNYFANHILSNYIDKVFLYDKKLFSSLNLIFKLRSEKYDLVIDLFDNASKTSELFIKLIKPKQSLGLDKSNSDIYTKTIPLKPKFSTHIIDRVGYLLSEFTDTSTFDKLDFSPEYNFKTDYDVSSLIDTQNPNLLINLFGSNETKFWGIDNHINLINKLLNNTNFNILISTTADREEYLNKIIKNLDYNLEIDNKRLKIVPFNKDLDFISKVISKSDLVLTPDTSIVHISAAFKVKCVVLYPDTEEIYGGKYWTPYNSPYIALNIDNGSLSSIRVEDVYNAITSI